MLQFNQGLLEFKFKKDCWCFWLLFAVSYINAVESFLTKAFWKDACPANCRTGNRESLQLNGGIQLADSLDNNSQYHDVNYPQSKVKFIHSKALNTLFETKRKNWCNLFFCLQETTKNHSMTLKTNYCGQLHHQDPHNSEPQVSYFN